MSSARMEALSSSQYFYRVAIRGLPQEKATIATSGTDVCRCASWAGSHSESAESEVSYVANRDSSKSNGSYYSASSLNSDHCLIDGTTFPKPPLVKVPADDANKATAQSVGHSRSRDWIAETNVQKHSITVAHQTQKNSASHQDIWPRDHHIELYNEYLNDFKAMLLRHLSNVEFLLASTQEMQVSIHLSRRVFSHGDDEDDRKADLKDSIHKLSR